MKIEHKDNIQIIKISHKGYDTHYRHQMSHISPFFDDESNTKPVDMLTMEFSDTKEIETLIYILTDFLKRQAVYHGTWISDDAMLEKTHQMLSQEQKLHEEIFRNVWG